MKSIRQVDNVEVIVHPKALVYCRVSSERQKNEGHGLDSQESRCVKYARDNGYEVEKIFRDSFTGGGDFMKRPAMSDLIKHTDSNPYQNYVVIFDDIKRFARDVEFHIKLRSTFKVRGVILKCLNYNFDDTPEGKFVETIIAAGSELERSQNKRQVNQKMRARLEMGLWTFAPKRGYININTLEYGKLQVRKDPDASILAEALDGFSSGKFPRKIDACRFLVERGFWKKQKPEKYIHRFDHIAKDPFYAGYIEYKKWEVERREGKHDGIISIKTFEKIQRRLKGELSGKRIRLDITEDFPLRGLINCADCGEHLTASKSKGRNNTYYYYFCQNAGCESYRVSIKKDHIENEFQNVLEKGRLKDGIENILGIIFDEVWKEEVGLHNKEEAAKVSRRKKLNEDIGRLTDLVIKADDDVLRVAYETQMKKKIKERDESVPHLVKNNKDSVPYRTALDKSVQLLKNPCVVWNKLNVEEKHELFFYIFGEKLEYGKKGSYRTDKIPYATMLFEEFVVENSPHVEMAGIEPASKKGSIYEST